MQTTMKNVKISVITVVYNDVDNIERTIANVLKQTYPNLEYIVVDGNSTDGTVNIIKKYSNQLAYWCSEKDKGIYDAMNKGVQHCTGEWIIFRNCGDYFRTPTAIEDVFSKYDDKGEDFIICDTRFFRKNYYIDRQPSILKKQYFDCMPVLHPSTFIRRSTQIKYPFDINYRYSADYCFFIEAFSNGATYKYFHYVLALFNNEDGATSNNYPISIKENIYILKRHNAPKGKIRKLKHKLLKEILKSYIKCIMPFYSLYVNHNLKKQGWIPKSSNYILSEI